MNFLRHRGTRNSTSTSSHPSLENHHRVGLTESTPLHSGGFKSWGWHWMGWLYNGSSGITSKGKTNTPKKARFASTAAKVTAAGLFVLAWMGAAAYIRRKGHMFVMSSPKATFYDHCRAHYLGNDTWGREVAPYVDKLRAKELVREMLHSAGEENLVKVVPTLTHFDETNISDFTVQTMRSLPQPYVIKATHTSGGVARVINSTYECFKRCKFKRQERISPLRKAVRTAKGNAKHFLKLSYNCKSEKQYCHIPHAIIIEKHLDMDGMVELWCFAVKGHPVFCRVDCAPDQGYGTASVSARFETLDVGMKGQKRCDNVTKPLAFDRAMKAVRILEEQLPGIVRLDLYANATDVFFSEFTFTHNRCSFPFEPLVADGLIYALHYGEVASSRMTPEFVESVINNGKEWIRVDLNQRGQELTKDVVTAHLTERDLCKGVENPANCKEACRDVKSFPLKCVLVDGKGITVLGQKKLPTVSSEIDAVEMPLVLGLAVGLILMKFLGVGKKPGSPFLRNALYLSLVTIYKCGKPHHESLFTPMFLSMLTAKRSFQAFALVHPVDNPTLALSHIVTYWFPIAAWRAKTLQKILF